MAAYRYPRSVRLTEARDFQQVFRRPLKSADAYFTVLARKTAGGTARLGLAISKKQARRAVDRNRLKRLARETFRRHRGSLPPLDLVIMARSAAVAADNGRLVASLERHFRRLSEKTQPS